MLEGRKTIAEIVARGQERGEIDRMLKKDKVALQFLQMVLGTVLLWSLHEKPALAGMDGQQLSAFLESDRRLRQRAGIMKI